MKAKLKPIKELLKSDQKVKAEVPFSVRLYQESDQRVRHRARREGIPIAQVICDVVDEYFRQQELLPNDAEQRDETLAELRRLHKTVHELSDGLIAHHAFLESNFLTISDELGAHTGALHVGKLLGNAHYKLLGLIYESQLFVQQVLVQFLVDPHLKACGEKLDIHRLLTATHAPEAHLSDGAKAVQRVASAAARQARMEACQALLDDSAAPKNSAQTAQAVLKSAAPSPQPTEAPSVTSATQDEVRQRLLPSR